MMEEHKTTINWQIVMLAIIAATPPTLVALAALWQAVETHRTVNSRMSEMLELTKTVATASAKAKEQEAQHIRDLEASVRELTKTKGENVSTPKGK